MAYLKFVDDLVPYKGGVSKISENVIKVTTDIQIKPNASGFRAYLDTTMTRLLGDWRDFNHLYLYDGGNSWYLSNNATEQEKNNEN